MGRAQGSESSPSVTSTAQGLYTNLLRTICQRRKSTSRELNGPPCSHHCDCDDSRAARCICFSIDPWEQQSFHELRRSPKDLSIMANHLVFVCCESAGAFESLPPQTGLTMSSLHEIMAKFLVSSSMVIQSNRSSEVLKQLF